MYYSWWVTINVWTSTLHDRQPRCTRMDSRWALKLPFSSPAESVRFSAIRRPQIGPIAQHYWTPVADDLTMGISVTEMKGMRVSWPWLPPVRRTLACRRWKSRLKGSQQRKKKGRSRLRCSYHRTCYEQPRFLNVETTATSDPLCQYGPVERRRNRMCRGALDKERTSWPVRWNC